jgi:GTPase SAR1 family protein
MIHIKDCIEKSIREEVVGLPVGMKCLDKLLGGLYSGEMTVICGDANDGKTALMIRMIHRLAIEEDIPVLIVLNGMNERTFLACMAAFYCSIITGDIHEVFVNPTCKSEVDSYWNLLEKKPLYIVHANELSEKGMESLKQTVSDYEIKAIFVDYHSWLYFHGNESSEQGLCLKSLANELQVAVIAEYRLWLIDQENSLFLERFNDDFACFADNVVSIFDFANHGIYEDMKGENLRGCVRLKIMKHKGVASIDEDVIFPKLCLFCRSKERATLYEAKEMIDSNPSIKNLIDEFDCDIVCHE